MSAGLGTSRSPDMSRLVLLLGLASLGLLFIPGAAAQNPTTTLTVTDLPPNVVGTNETLYPEPFQVHLAISDILCPTGGTFVVSIMAEHQANLTGNESVVFEFSPPQIGFAAPRGEFFSEDYRGTEDVMLTIRPDRIPHDGLLVPVSVTAEYQGGNNQCSGGAQAPAASDTESFTIRFNRGEPGPIDPTPELAGPGLVLTGLAAALLVGSLRRVRQS